MKSLGFFLYAGFSAIQTNGGCRICWCLWIRNFAGENNAALNRLGKHALSIRVVDLDSATPIGYGRASIRYVTSIVSAIVIYIGYLWMLWDREKQCWHDKTANSVVVPEAAYPVQ